MAYYTSYFPRGKFDILRWASSNNTLLTLFKHIPWLMAILKIWTSGHCLWMSMCVCLCLHEMDVQLKTINTSNEALNTRIMARQMYDGIHTNRIRNKTKQKKEQEQEQEREQIHQQHTNNIELKFFKWSFWFFFARAHALARALQKAKFYECVHQMRNCLH